MIFNFDPVCTGKHFVITKRACAILHMVLLKYVDLVTLLMIKIHEISHTKKFEFIVY